MIGDLFDSPWKILIVAVVIIVLFGSKKLPSAARSLGQSMRILKREVQGLHEDEPEPGRSGAQAAARQAQAGEMQQIGDLPRSAVRDAAPQTPVAAAAEASGPAGQRI
jgi:sec-independent protein translocase protein TatA